MEALKHHIYITGEYLLAQIILPKKTEAVFLSVTPTFGWQQMALFTEEQLLSPLAKSRKKKLVISLFSSLPSADYPFWNRYHYSLFLFEQQFTLSLISRWKGFLDFSACVCLSQITEKYRSRSQEGNHPLPFSSNCRFAAFSTGDRITAGGGCWSPKLTFMARLSIDSLCCRTILNPALMSNHQKTRFFLNALFLTYRRSDGMKYSQSLVRSISALEICWRIRL